MAGELAEFAAREWRRGYEDGKQVGYEKGLEDGREEIKREFLGTEPGSFVSGDPEIELFATLPEVRLRPIGRAEYEEDNSRFKVRFLVELDQCRVSLWAEQRLFWGRDKERARNIRDLAQHIIVMYMHHVKKRAGTNCASGPQSK